MSIYYIADWHYNHENVIHFDNRPFEDVKEMNSKLIKNWKERVTDNDTVYVLGDMFWSKYEKEMLWVLDQLPGKKVLIIGNHDRMIPNSRVKDKFVQCTHYLEIDDKGRKVVLCHYPIPCFKNHYYGWYHLYGHVHNSFEWNMMEKAKNLMFSLYGHPCHMFNVGVMMPYMNYTPRTLDEIIIANNEEELGNEPDEVS